MLQVKVKVDMKVYHVPGFKEGMDIKDKQGTVDKNVTEFKGVTLSPNYPWKIRFDYEADDKPKKFFVHLVCSVCPLVDVFWRLCL